MPWRNRCVAIVACSLLLLSAPLVEGQGYFGGVYDSLLLWHKLDESAGSTTAVDSSGNDYTSGTVTGVTFNSYSATMLGTNNGFQLNSAFVTAFKTLTEFTIMCFVSASNRDADTRIFAYNAGADQYMFLTHTAQGNRPGYKVYVNPTTYQSPTLSNQMSGWYHLAVTVTDSSWVTYQDATPNTVAASSFPQLRSLTGAINTAFIGCSTATNMNAFTGILRDFRVYSRVLTQAEITWAYSGSRAPTQRPTVMPTLPPTTMPTQTPTERPTTMPTTLPTTMPTLIPTQLPTRVPTEEPTVMPTQAPTLLPTTPPTRSPTLEPSQVPTQPPTTRPSPAPTALPTASPTRPPSTRPTFAPSGIPSCAPTPAPTTLPTTLPTRLPSTTPTKAPTGTPTNLPTERPTVLPTQVPTLQPTLVSVSPTQHPTTRPTTNPTQAPTANMWDLLAARAKRVQESCSFQSGPLFGPLGFTFGLIVMSMVAGLCGKRTKRYRIMPSGPGLEPVRGNEAQVLEIRQRNLAAGRKVFWGGLTSTSISQIVTPNPLRAGESDVWRDDMRYHMCNHQWLMSMAFSDPLDPYGGAWGHRAMFWHLAMLLFLVVVIIKISIGRRPLPLYPIVAGSAVFLAIVLPFVYRAIYRWPRSSKVGKRLRRLVVNTGLFVLGLAFWGTGYGLARPKSGCTASLPWELLNLWGLAMGSVLLWELPRLFLLFIPLSVSLRVELFRWTVLSIGEWKKQLLTHVFHPYSRLAKGELRDTIRDWVETHHCAPSFINEYAAFVEAISHTWVRIPWILHIVEYDVPEDLKETFRMAPAVLSPLEPEPDEHLSAYPERIFRDTVVLTGLNEQLEQEEGELYEARFNAEGYVPVLDKKRRLLDGGMFRTDDEHLSRSAPGSGDREGEHAYRVQSPSSQVGRRKHNLRLRAKVRTHSHSERPSRDSSSNGEQSDDDDGLREESLDTPEPQVAAGKRRRRLSVLTLPTVGITAQEEAERDEDVAFRGVILVMGEGMDNDRRSSASGSRLAANKVKAQPSPASTQDGPKAQQERSSGDLVAEDFQDAGELAEDRPKARKRGSETKGARQSRPSIVSSSPNVSPTASPRRASIILRQQKAPHAPPEVDLQVSPKIGEEEYVEVRRLSSAMPDMRRLSRGGVMLDPIEQSTPKLTAAGREQQPVSRARSKGRGTRGRWDVDPFDEDHEGF